MEFGILGPLEVRDGDRVVALRGRRQRALLAVLILHAGSVVPAERLLDELWGDDVPESGLTALQVRLSQLRRSLGTRDDGGVILTRQPGYLLRAEPDAIDARRFERLVADGRSLLAEGEPGRAAGLLREALALWRGPALADFAGEPFARNESARLEALRLEALEERIAADLALGRHAHVVAELEALVADHPLRERLRAQLMLALYRSGRQADALGAYRAARRALVEELGLEPGEELRRLEQRILAQDASLALAERSEPEPAVEAAQTSAPAERKLVTVVFAGLAGAAELAEEEDPERARALLERYHGTLAREVEAAGGTLETLAGGVVVAVFGAPVAQEDHAERALHAALAMQRRLAEAVGDRPALRVGVATGEVLVGRAGEPERFVTGAAVSVAARLEQAAAPGEVLVASRTAEAARGAFEFAEPRADAAGVEDGGEGRRLVRGLSDARVRTPGRPETPLVGREGELDLLRATYRRASAEGRPCLVTITGDAGVGKTRLVGELWDWLAEQSPEPSRRTGRCLSYGRATTYRPLGEILREELGLLGTDPPELIRRGLAGREILGLSLGLDPATDVHPRAARARLGDAWVAFVQELVSARPLVVRLEDLHWAEDALLDLLERLVREVEGPFLLVATTRPELLDRRPSWGRGARDSATIRLEPLSALDTELLLDLLLEEELPDPLRRLVVDRAEGNPFFVEELLDSLADRGLLGRGATAARAGGPAELEIPDSVQGVLAARVDLLPPTEKAALQAAAVVGRTFWRGAVRALLDGALPDFAVLEARDFVRRRPVSVIAGELEFGFKHALTREVVYAGIPRASRARLHAAHAGWLEGVVRGQHQHAALLAHHYAEAVRPGDVDLAWADAPDEHARLREKAQTWLVRAAEHAVSSYEIDEGLALLERALELEEGRAERSELWLRVGRANALKFDGRAFWSAMERARECAADDEARAEICGELALEVFYRSGMWVERPAGAEVEEWIEQALAHPSAESPGRVRGLVARALSSADAAVAQAAADEATALAERLDDPELLAFAWDAQQVVARTKGDFERSWRWAERLFALLDRVSDPDVLADIAGSPIPTVVATGRFETARALAVRCDEITRPLTPHHRVHGVSALVEVEELLGGWEAIRSHASRVAAAVAANADTPCLRNARSLLVCALAEAYLGDEDEAARLELEAEELRLPGKHVLDAPRLRLALLRGDRPRAKTLLERLLSDGGWYSRGHGTSLATLTARVEGLAALGPRERAEREAAELLLPGTYLEPIGLRALGLVRDDAELIERALARFEALGLEWHAAETRPLLAPASTRPG